MTSRASLTFVAAWIVALSVCPITSAQNPIGVEDLRSATEGFQQESLLLQFAEMGRLVADPATHPAIARAIHGDHREYRLKIERYLDQLADERWLAREEAERTLAQIGGRAITQIEERSIHGRTFEERRRSERVLQAISAAGKEAARRELRMLRGLVATAIHLPSSPELREALVSVLAHSDSIVRDLAARSLGAVGSLEDARALASRARREGRPNSARRACLSGLARIGADAEGALLLEVLGDTSQFTKSEQSGVLLDLTLRPDDAAIRRRILELGAKLPEELRGLLQLPAREKSTGTLSDATIRIGTGEVTTGAVESVTSSTIRIQGAVEGLPVLELARDSCTSIEFTREAVATDSRIRMFLVQGSLLAVELVAIGDDVLRVRHDAFGDLTVPRTEVQGLAIDPTLDRLIGASNQFDRVRLRDGALRDGRVLSIDGATLALETADKSTIAIPAAEIAGVMFRRPNAIEPDPDPLVRLDLVTGEKLLAYLGRADAESFDVAVTGIGAARIQSNKIKRMDFGVSAGAQWGFTLLAEFSENRVVEIDERGNELFVINDVFGAWDAECLDNGNILIAEYALDRVVEVTRSGQEVWSYDQVRNPYDVDRLPNGNTLIADTIGLRVIEVTPEKQIVWSYTGVKTYDVERLPDGNTLIVDATPGKDRVIEVDRAGQIVWEYSAKNSLFDADRLANGNTLITERGANRVIEVDPTGQIVLEITGLNAPSDADRLPNGHTVVGENGAVREFDRQGRQVAEISTNWVVEVNRY